MGSILIIFSIDVRDLLLQSIGVLMQYNEYVTFIEDLPSDSHSSGEHDYARGRGAPTAKSESERSEGSMQAMLVRGLLHAFDKKFWITVSSILLRIWKVNRSWPLSFPLLSLCSV